MTLSSVLPQMSPLSVSTIVDNDAKVGEDLKRCSRNLPKDSSPRYWSSFDSRLVSLITILTSVPWVKPRVYDDNRSRYKLR